MTDLYDFSDLEASLSLSTDALSALHEFLAEKREADEAFNALQATAARKHKQNMTSRSKSRSGSSSRSQTPPSAVSDGSTSDSDGEDALSDHDDDDDNDDDHDDQTEAQARLKLTMASFKEDWQLSQFWYDDETARTMGDELIRTAKGGTIVCVSAPTVFLYLKASTASETTEENKNLDLPNQLVLLEIDTRFAVFPEFKLYDYTKPLDVDGLEEGGDLRGAAAAVALDPPFLNDDCMTKSSETVRTLCNKNTSILVSTGWTVRDSIKRNLNANIAKFRPRHKGGLANAFRCYVNYTADNDDFALSTDADDGCNDFLDQV